MDEKPKPNDGGWLYDQHTGLTVRDMFAYGAIAAILEPEDSISVYPQLANMAYAFADAMLKERGTPIPTRSQSTGPK